MFRGVIAQGAGIVALAMVLGLGFNAARGDHRIELGRDYFQAASLGNGPSGAAPARVGPVLPDVPPPPSAAAVLADRAAAEFTVIDGRVAKALFDANALGAVAAVFVDARDDAHYEAGHVPGALQLDYYALRPDVEPVLPWLRLAPWLVVYCESSECEDGFLLCRALRDEFGIRGDRILLHLGGVREWRAMGLPLEEGPAR